MNRYLIPILSLFLASCVSNRSQISHSSQPSQNDLRLPAGNSGSLTYPILIRTLEESQPSTVEQALNVLASKYPDYFSFHTFIYQSFSLQEASFNSPRALVFGRDGKLVLTFNGSKNQKGADTIEVMRFKNDSKEFEFREIRFAADRNEYSEDEIGNGRKFAVSAPNGNGGKCLMCHTDSPRPNWDPYPFWPGVYGSHSDFENADFKAPLKNGRVQFAEIPSSDSSYQERQHYLSFMANERLAGRYKLLPPLSSDLGPEKTGNMIERPNLLLSNQFNKLNGERIARLVKTNPSLFAARKQITKAILCGDLSLDRSTKQFSPTEKFVINRLGGHLISMKSRFKDLFGTDQISRMGLKPTLPDIVVTAKIIDLVGKDQVGNWSLPLGADSYNLSSFFGGFVQTSLKAYLLAPLIRETMPELINTVAYNPSDEPSFDQNSQALKDICESL